MCLWRSGAGRFLRIIGNRLGYWSNNMSYDMARVPWDSYSFCAASSVLYIQKTLIQETLFHHRLLPSKPHPQLCNRFPPSIPLPVSTTYRLFLNPQSQTFLIPVPVSLSSMCDTRPLHPLANTSSKPLVVPLV